MPTATQTPSPVQATPFKYASTPFGSCTEALTQRIPCQNSALADPVGGRLMGPTFVYWAPTIQQECGPEHEMAESVWGNVVDETAAVTLIQ